MAAGILLNAFSDMPAFGGRLAVCLASSLLALILSAGPALGADTDDDGIDDGVDNCVEVANADQIDTDGDELGDVCDDDDDNDGLDDRQERDPSRLLATGKSHGCVIDDMGVNCWGDYEWVSIAPTDFVDPTTIVAGNYHTCAIDAGQVRCWGDNQVGQLDVPEELSNPVALTAGGYHNCALDDNGLRCWGWNIFGQANAPADLQNPVTVSAGYEQTCAIDDNGVRCWDNTGFAQSQVPQDLSNPRAISVGTFLACALDDHGVRCWGGEALPVPKDLANPVSVSAAQSHACAIDDSGVRCWGLNDWGQTTVPPGLSNPVAIKAYDNHVCALDDSGVRCWGRSDLGQTRVPVSTMNPVVVSTGSDHTCAMGDNGVRCWGMGDQSTVPSDLSNPTSVVAGGYQTCTIDDSGLRCWGNETAEVPAGLSNPVLMAVGRPHVCALDDGGVRCWGSDRFGQTDVPAGLSRPSAMDAGFDHTCALDENGVHCWGEGGPSDVPSDLSNPVAVAAGGATSCAIDDTGVRCWGDLGDGKDQIPDFSNPHAIDVGVHHVCVLDDLGVHCWGSNVFGQIDVPDDLTGPMVVATGQHHTCVIDNGDIRCWGSNAAGQISVPRSPQFSHLPFTNTDPLDPDTDSDGYQDGAERYPRDPARRGRVTNNTGRPTNGPVWSWTSQPNGTGTFRLKLDSEDFTTGAVQTTDLTYSPGFGLTDGLHVLYVQERLEDGTYADVGSADIVYDGSPPEVRVTERAQVIDSADLRLTIGCEKAAHELGCEVFYATDPAMPSADFHPLGESGSVTISPNDLLRFFAVDPLGNRSEIFTADATLAAEVSLDASASAILQAASLAMHGRIKVGSASANVAGLVIALDVALPNGEVWSAIATTTTDTNGQFFFDDILTALRDALGASDLPAGPYVFTARFPGSSVFQADSSAPQTVLIGRTAGYALIVQGRISHGEGSSAHRKTGDRVYDALLARGLEPENIFYLGYDDAVRPGDRLTSAPSLAAIQSTMASLGERMQSSPAPFYLTLVDHGTDGSFHVNEDEILTPGALRQYLEALETAADASGNPADKERVLFLGFCYSGEFVADLAAEGRVIVASAARDEESFKGLLEEDGVRVGEYFLAELFIELRRGMNLRTAFVTATDKTERFTRRNQHAEALPPFFDGALQHPLLEDNAGDGIAGSNELLAGFGDGELSSGIYLGVGPTIDANSAEAPVTITGVTPTRYLSADESGTILYGKVNDNSQVATSVRIEIRDPNQVLADPDPARGSAEQREIVNSANRLPTILENDPREPGTYRWRLRGDPGVDYTTPGRYEIYYTAVDAETDRVSPAGRSVVYKNKPDNEPPDSFELVAPEDGSWPRTETLFSWTQAIDSDDANNIFNLTYTLVISDQPDFSNDPRFVLLSPEPGTFFIEEEIKSTSHAVGRDAALVDGRSYYWKVEAVDGYGAIRSSDVRSFTTDNRNAFAGPDLMVRYTSSRRYVGLGQTFDVGVEVRNLGGQLADNTATNIRLSVRPFNGVDIVGAPNSCEDLTTWFSCSLGDLPEGDTVTLTFAVTATEIRQKLLLATVTGLTSTGQLQPDDRITNNSRELAVQVVDGPFPEVTLHASVLPGSRCVQVGELATAFATMINAGNTAGIACSIDLVSSLDSEFFYQTTDPATNAVVGERNRPVDIAAGGVQSFVVGFTPVRAFDPFDVELGYRCSNADPASTTTGLNTVLLAASESAVPDVIALAATASGDGVVRIAEDTGAGVFAIASINVGASANITVSADTGPVDLPLGLFVCQTDPTNGECLDSLAPTVTTRIEANSTPTFSVFVTSSETIAFDPATHRIFVRFNDADGVTRGSTSVAAMTRN